MKSELFAPAYDLQRAIVAGLETFTQPLLRLVRVFCTRRFQAFKIWWMRYRDKSGIGDDVRRVDLIMWATGTGSDVWKRIAAPMVGGSHAPGVG